MSIPENKTTHAVADPGFPVGGGTHLVGGATPEVVTFRKLCMSTRKNLDPWGGVRIGSTPGSVIDMVNRILSSFLVL